jgi:large subunit ribosomal protein L13
MSAREAILGKISVQIALLLMGKGKPIYDQMHDIGDYVVVTNARHVKVTGKKSQQKVYRHHSMYPGGLKEIPYQEMMLKKPEEVSNGRN